MNKHYTLRNRYFSRQINLSSIFIILIFFILVTTFMVFSLLSGDIKISFMDLLTYLIEEESKYDLIIDNIRLPRIILAFIVGALLGISGLILQTIVKNPLASPDILGISNGASVGVLIFLSYFADILSIKYLPLAGMTGAFLTISFIYIFTISKGFLAQRIILVGIAVSLFMGAVATFLFIFSSSSASLAAYLWLTGSVYGANWEEINIILIFTFFLFPFLLFASKKIDFIQLSDESSISLGLNIFSLRTLLVFISVAFAALAVSFAGAISFVGLISPHIAKRLVENNFSYLAFLSALIGALIVLCADFVGRILFSPLDLPAGIFVSLIGAPFFLYLLIKQFNSKKV